MNESVVLITRLKELIGQAFKVEEFGELLRTNVSKEDFDFDGLPKSMGDKAKVSEAVDWADRYGALKQVLWLAHLASQKRPQRDDLKKLVADIEAVVEAPDIPLPLSAALGQFAKGLSSLWNLSQNLRLQFRKESHKPYDLPGRYHLSDSVEHRLAAVLTLEVEPDAAYVRWLSERVTVETPLVATLATKALIIAALWLDRKTLPRLKAFIRETNERVINMANVGEPPAGVPFAVDLDARRRNLNIADSLIETRNGAGFLNMELEERDQFLTTLVEAFKLDRTGFEKLCWERLQSKLERLAFPNDPMELIIVTVVVKARDMEWERLLIQAAYEERKTEAIFEHIHKKYI